MCSRSVAQHELLLQFWQIELWWPGAIPNLVVTVPESEISSTTFSVSEQKIYTEWWTRFQSGVPSLETTLAVFKTLISRDFHSADCDPQYRIV
jgi:hypothetical protein